MSTRVGEATFSLLQTGSSIAIGASSDLTTLDAHNAQFTIESAILGNVWDTLVGIGPTGEVIPGLAESWELVSDTVWEFKLIQGVSFHNGEPFTAEAVRFAVLRYQEPDKGRFTRVATSIDSVEIVDDYTVRIVTKAPNPLLLDDCRFMNLIPPVWGAEVGDEGIAETTYGTGPYKFVSWTPNGSVVLTANPDYRGGTPAITDLEFRIVPEIATRVSTLKAGETQIIFQLTPDQIPSIEEDESLAVMSVQAPRVAVVGFNKNAAGGEPLADARVRRAMYMAINRPELIEAVLLGHGQIVATLAAINAYGHNPNLEPLGNDPEQAIALLTEAGYADGFELDFAVPNGGSLIKPTEVGQVLAAYWEAVGIKANIRTLDTSTFVEERDGHTISPLHLWNWVAVDVDRPFWNNFFPDSPYFYSPVTPEVQDQLTALIAEERTTMDVARRLELLHQIQQVIYDETAIIALYQQDDIYGLSAGLTGVEVDPAGRVSFAAATIT
jgi:peptide/nickel transport system substrate-binding protein